MLEHMLGNLARSTALLVSQQEQQELLNTDMAVLPLLAAQANIKSRWW